MLDNVLGGLFTCLICCWADHFSSCGAHVKAHRHVGLEFLASTYNFSFTCSYIVNESNHSLPFLAFDVAFHSHITTWRFYPATSGFSTR